MTATAYIKTFNLPDEQTSRNLSREALLEGARLTVSVMMEETRVFKKPTGRYTGSIRQSEIQESGGVLSCYVAPHVLYAFPWIETGRRRGKSTKFPGYQIVENTRDKAEPIIQREVSDFIAREMSKIRAGIARGSI